jgi:hypothetical protein
MKRPVESEYTSHVAYTRALEEYCDSLPQLAQEPKQHECTYGYSECRALAIANAALAQPVPVTSTFPDFSPIFGGITKGQP